MRSPKVVVVFCLVVLVTAQDDPNSLEKRAGGKRYCGETLNAMLMFLCDSVYKRSGSAETRLVNWMPSEPMVNPFLYGERSFFPFRPRDSAVSFIPRQYKRRGVADECCSKPCTLSELSTYCGPRFS